MRSDANYIYVGSGAVPGERVVVTALETPVNGTPVRTPDDVAEEASKVASSDESNEGN